MEISQVFAKFQEELEKEINKIGKIRETCDNVYKNLEDDIDVYIKRLNEKLNSTTDIEGLGKMPEQYHRHTYVTGTYVEQGGQIFEKGDQNIYSPPYKTKNNKNSK